MILPSFLIVSNAYADDSIASTKSELNADEGEYLGHGMFDGNIWKSLTGREKGAYFFGYSDAVVNTAMQHISDEQKKKKVIGELPTATGELAVDDLIGEVDDFYLEDENLNIPVPYALLIIRNRLAIKGVDDYEQGKGIYERDAKKYLEYLRDGFNR